MEGRAMFTDDESKGVRKLLITAMKSTIRFIVGVQEVGSGIGIPWIVRYL
jgi:hypothetical protein